ncbi:autophagy-related Atg10 [Pyrenophora seminiperda CCB06]|uniref:Ubiquitin-like-conjugating enzyme ATG10 n=1 Tax=Pyrenophora seminiperda CCB06 TaxID=1302712 RepID=A0A3M7MIG3_9PLEO|nr:autophagy-related Atg10 [Pyrenophora seminiperda CCB06]
MTVEDGEMGEAAWAERSSEMPQPLLAHIGKTVPLASITTTSRHVQMVLPNIAPMPPSLSVFPHLTDAEFGQACHALSHAFQQRGISSGEWQSLHVINLGATTTHVRITKPLPTPTTHDASTNIANHDDDEIVQVFEHDPEVLSSALAPPAPVVHYDVLLSPTYRVPVLYISIHDLLHRYPPTLNTLYGHVVPEHFRPQVESVGVIGGITITNHPATGKPVFFIHPCRTAEVMEASIGESACITAEEYLVAWIGALGESVGLHVPLCLARALER